MDAERRLAAERLTEVADRFDELADVAELMDDEHGARRLRDLAAMRYEEAMAMLADPDDPPSET